MCPQCRRREPINIGVVPPQCLRLCAPYCRRRVPPKKSSYAPNCLRRVPSKLCPRDVCVCVRVCVSVCVSFLPVLSYGCVCVRLTLPQCRRLCVCVRAYACVRLCVGYMCVCVSVSFQCLYVCVSIPELLECVCVCVRVSVTPITIVRACVLRQYRYVCVCVRAVSQCRVCVCVRPSTPCSIAMCVCVCVCVFVCVSVIVVCPLNCRGRATLQCAVVCTQRRGSRVAQMSSSCVHSMSSWSSSWSLCVHSKARRRVYPQRRCRPRCRRVPTPNVVVVSEGPPM